MSWGETIFLKKIIEGTKGFVSSNNPIVILNSQSNKAWGNNEIAGSFTPKKNGQCKLNINSPNNIAPTWGFNVFLNGNVVASCRGTKEGTYNISVTFNVSKGNSYVIRAVYGTVGSVFYTNEVSICADIIDTSLFDYTIGGNE